MEKLWSAAAAAADRVARSRPVTSLRRRFDVASTDADDQRGQGLSEYALILGLIAVVAIAALMFLGTSVTTLFEDIINEGFARVADLIT